MNQNDVYTKQQLRDMGFAFTTNGDIVTPKETAKDLKKYLENQKQWKPSEEQMTALKLVKDLCLLKQEIQESLVSLYDDLEKL